MNKEDPVAKILRSWEALDEETQETIRTEINMRARQRFDANFLKEEASILEDLRKGFEEQGFDEHEASSGAQDQLILEKFFEILSTGIQSKHEANSVVDLIKFIQTKNLALINELTDIFSDTKDERIRKLLIEMLLLQRIVQEPHLWHDVNSLMPETAEGLNSSLLDKFKSITPHEFDSEKHGLRNN